MLLVQDIRGHHILQCLMAWLWSSVTMKKIGAFALMTIFWLYTINGYLFWQHRSRMTSSMLSGKMLFDREIKAALFAKLESYNARQTRREDEMVFTPILMPVCGRPEYLEPVLRALREVDDVDKTVLIVSSDCYTTKSAKEAMKLFETIEFPFPVLSLKHERPYGSIPSIFRNNEYATTSNIYFLLSFAFDVLKAESAIVLESDLVPAKDMFRYFQFTHSHFLRDNGDNVAGINASEIFTINGYSDFKLAKDEKHLEHKLFERGKFNHFYSYIFVVWGWATSRTIWNERIRSNFSPFNSWDYHMEKIKGRFGLKSISSYFSHIKHIGFKGENFKSKEDDFYNLDYNRIIFGGNRSFSYVGEDAIWDDSKKAI